MKLVRIRLLAKSHSTGGIWHLATNNGIIYGVLHLDTVNVYSGGAACHVLASVTHTCSG